MQVEGEMSKEQLWEVVMEEIATVYPTVSNLLGNPPRIHSLCSVGQAWGGGIMLALRQSGQTAYTLLY